MDLDRDALAIVHHSDEPLLLVDVDLEQIHLAISLVVIGGIDKHFVEDLVEGGNEGDLSIIELMGALREDPLLRFLHFDAADISVGP